MDIQALTGISGLSSIGGDPTVLRNTGAAGATDFASQLTGAVNGLQQMQSKSDTLNIQAVSGNLGDIQQATIAAAQVSTSLQLAAAVRSQAVAGFNQILNMSA
jgi:flagellar hook-basal body complex protein FliE